MRALLLWMVVSLTVVLAVLGVLIALFFSRLQRRNRVDPEHESMAPVLWLWSPTAAPRLHRRLQAATAPVRQIDQLEAAPPARSKITRRPVHETAEHAPNSAAQLRQTLRTQAVQLDLDVVMASRQPRAVRRRALRALGAQVSEVERLSGRLVQQHRQTSAPVSVPGPHPIGASTPEVLADVAQQLDVLEQAHDEVLQIERSSGLLDPDTVLRQMSAPPQGAPVAAGPPPRAAAARSAGPPPATQAGPTPPAAPASAPAPAAPPPAPAPRPQPSPPA